MWDCKTSKMSQSPRAALNAFGLFAAEAKGAPDGEQSTHLLPLSLHAIVRVLGTGCVAKVRSPRSQHERNGSAKASVAGREVRMENKRKHLELIQGVINRLSTNSFLLKGWSVVLVSALFALSASDSRPAFVLLAYIPASIFWGLDGFFLWQECRRSP